MTVEIEGLPADATDRQVKSMYFSNEHVVKTTTEINNITGACNGKAKVAVRCQNGLRSDALLRKLYNKGAKFRVTERTRLNKKSNDESN